MTEAKNRPAAAAKPRTTRRQKPTATAKASRWVAAGASVGVGMAMVGAMAGAAATSSSQPAVPKTVQRVVVPRQPVAAEPIVIVLPQMSDGPVQQPAVVSAMVTQPPAQPARPQPAPAPARKAASAPVAESGGS